MQTRVLTVNPIAPEEAVLREAAAVLQDGGLVAFPTETVYGLGANGLSADACKGIFDAKGRPADNPLILHIAKIEQVWDLSRAVPPAFYTLAQKFWPGPLTMIVKKSDRVPAVVSAGLDTVAIRMPSHPVAKKLIELADIPVAAPSANRSGSPSPTRFSHLYADMNGRAQVLIDGGDCTVGVESTVLDLTKEPYTVLRPGAVTLEMLQAVVPGVRPYVQPFQGGTPPSPGMKYRHYAPKAPVYVAADKGALKAAVRRFLATDQKVALLFDDVNMQDKNLCLLYPGAQDVAARTEKLFAALREGDELGADVILTCAVGDNDLGRAYMNRLLKAAGEGHVLKSPRHILFVCTGNTCRSAMAQALMKAKAGDRFCVQSAGLAAYAGDGASENACLVLQEKGIDASAHRARILTRELIDWADLILTMTENHRRAILNAVPTAPVWTVAAYAGQDKNITDPYGGPPDIYRACRDELEKLIDIIIHKTEEERNENCHRQ